MSSNNEESTLCSILSTFSLTIQNSQEKGRFEKLTSLKKILQKELNKSITIDECDAVLLAGALLLNDTNTVKEQAHVITDINIRLWGNAVDPLSKWISQHQILPQVHNMNKFIEGNTPLHFAVLTGNFDNIAFLLSKSADPFLKNAQGDKPLQLCQDYHRKLHGKGDRKRKNKRHKSLKKSKNRKSHKRSKSCKGDRGEKETQTQRTSTERSNSYDNDADDENESDFYYNNEENDGDESSLSSSISSQSPMHLSCKDFDQLFSNAVKNVTVDGDKIMDKSHKVIQKKSNKDGNAKNKNSKKSAKHNKLNKKCKNKNKSKLKCKTMRKNHKSKKNAHNGKNRNKNKRSHANNRRKRNNRKNNTKRRHPTHKQVIPHSQPTKPCLHKSDSISISSTSTHSHPSLHSLSSPCSSSTSTSCTYSDTISSLSTSTPSDTEHSTLSDSDSQSTDGRTQSLSASTSVTLSDTESATTSPPPSLSHCTPTATTTTNINRVEINIDHKNKNGKIIKTLSITKNLSVDAHSHSSSDTHTNEYESSSTNDEIYISSDMESSSTLSGIHTSSESNSSSNSADSCGERKHRDHKDKDSGDAINKLLQESMQSHVQVATDNGADLKEQEHDLHSQLVPIILALSEINIFAESASLARIVKFICTLIFFVALHWLEGNSAAKMIVKVGVSIIYLAAMFGHRINEWKECIDAETVLRKQQWSKQRDKERQKRKEKLQKTLRSVEVKRCVAKKQRKFERDTTHKQDLFDWRARIRMMINHAESAFLQCKWEMAEIYFSRLLAFLMDDTYTDVNVFLNDRKRANLKINRRWKGMFGDHYSLAIAKMFSRRAYCLCKIKDGEYPHGAPANDAAYKTVRGHLELAVKDLGIAVALREISPVYQKFVKVYRVGSEVCENDIKYICEEKLDRLVEIIAAQLCDLLSLAALCDLKDEFEKAYEYTLQADDIIHCLNKFNKQYIGGCAKALKCITTENVTEVKTVCCTDNNASKLESKRILATIQNIQQRGLEDTVHSQQQRYLCLLDNSGNFKLCLNDIIPLKDIEPLLQTAARNTELSVVEELKECSGDIQRSKSMISLLQISRSGESKFYSLDMEDSGNNKLELMDDDELNELLSYPLRRKVDLNGYKQLTGNDKCSVKVQQTIDLQLKKIRLLRLQAANRHRAVNLKHEREKMKHNKANNVFSVLSSLENEKKKQKKKDKTKSKHHKIEKEKVIKSSSKHVHKNDDKTEKHMVSTKNNAFSASLPVITDGNDGDDEVKHNKDNKMDTDGIDNKDNKTAKDNKICKLKLIKSQSISLNMAPNPATPSSAISAETSGSGTSSVCSDATSIGTSSISTGIKSDKEEEDTKMSMVIAGKHNINNMDNPSLLNLHNKNKNKLKKKQHRRSQNKLKKLQKKKKKNIGKKKTKKNQSKHTKLLDNVSNVLNKTDKKKLLPNEDNDEPLSVSSEVSKSASIDANVADDDDSLSNISESTSSDSINHKKRPKNVPKLNKNTKNLKSPSKKYNFNQNHNRSRNIPPRQQSQNKRSPKDNNTKYRRKTDSNNKNKKSTDDDEPRDHWLWNVNCDFWPNCRNSRQCPFRHPTDKGSVVRRRRSTPKSGDIVGKPINCRFGRECSRMDCWFWHPGDDETFIDPSSIPTSPQTHDEPIINHRERTSSSHSVSSHSHSDPSVVGTNTTDNSYDIVEDVNNDNKVCEVSTDTSSIAVILTKKPLTNPWHKKPSKSAEITPKNEKVAVLSPSTYNNNKILDRHDSYSNNTPLTAPITVGAIYSNEFDIMDYDINDMIRPPTLSIPVRAREQKVKSSLNPHASAFSARKEAQKIPSAPIRPPMRSHFRDNKSKISPPFDPHSQLQNGGVFTPHNSTEATLSSTAKMFRLGTGITNNEWNGSINGNGYAVDEYKQAPGNYNNVRSGNGNGNANANANEVYYDYGDESKVVETVNVSQDKRSNRKQRPWICPSCSFLNEIGTTACELCSSLRPSENSKDTKKETKLTPQTQKPLAFVYDDDEEELHRNLSFNSLFYGNSYMDNKRGNKNDDIGRNVTQFNEGDHILYKGGKESIEGMIVTIRDIKETPWPIKIEYYSMNEFGKKRKQNMWVLPQELIKVHSNKQQEPEQEYDAYNNDDELYDYEDEEDDNNGS